MDHRHFENWLLNDVPLHGDERRVLEAHARTCPRCAALLQSNTALRRTKHAQPAPGFTTRFQARLAAQKAEQRRRSIVGFSSLVVGTLLLSAWYFSPGISAFVQSPSSFLVSWFTSLLMVVHTAQTVGETVSALGQVMARLMPLAAWMAFFSLVAGSALLWSFTFWKSSQFTRRVTEGG